MSYVLYVCDCALKPGADCRVRFPRFHSQPSLPGLPRSAGHHLQRHEHFLCSGGQAAKMVGKQMQRVTAGLSLKMSRNQCQGKWPLTLCTNLALVWHASLETIGLLLW
jgi:hypothetical protein